MKALITKITNSLSSAIVFGATILMAGLGLAAVGMLAFFALMAIGLALLVSPFVQTAHQSTDPSHDETVAA